jgi:hypothetical protein
MRRCEPPGLSPDVAERSWEPADATLVVEKSLGKYRMLDAAVDLSAWLRDGLEVYNLFVLMKPLFFEMLEAHGGEFEVSARKVNDDPLTRRLTVGDREVGEPGHNNHDRMIFARLTETGVPPFTPPPLEPWPWEGGTLENADLLQRLDAWREGDSPGPLIRWAAAHLRGEVEHPA